MSASKDVAARAAQLRDELTEHGLEALRAYDLATLLEG